MNNPVQGMLIGVSRTAHQRLILKYTMYLEFCPSCCRWQPLTRQVNMQFAKSSLYVCIHHHQEFIISYYHALYYSSTFKLWPLLLIILIINRKVKYLLRFMFNMNQELFERHFCNQK